LLLKNISNNDPIPFIATFNYVEGINNNSEVQLAGIKIGDVNKIKISPDGIIINGYIERKYNIPEDSIIKIKSEGIFGRKALSIEPGFGEYLDKSNQKYVFNQTQDSYSVDMFLRYLNDLNE
jgi:ABC-type transporter Mla subunit MlaD